MARIDVPTIRCDRCGFTTQDEEEFNYFVTWRNQWSGHDKKDETDFDLCKSCNRQLREWFNGQAHIVPGITFDVHYPNESVIKY